MHKQSFNQEWTVSLKSGLFGMKVDVAPKKVTLPYDAMVDSQRSPSGSYLSGWYNGGVWEYRKTFFVPSDYVGKKVIFQIDGAYEHAIVYLNGERAASRSSGYAQFFVDADAYLKCGCENEILIIVHVGDGARWYSGAGLFRDVWMLVGNLTHIRPHGVRITTPSVEPAEAAVHVAIAIRNESGMAKVATRVKTQILDAAGTVVASETSPVTAFRGGEEILRQHLTVYHPFAWNTEVPYLYSCKTEVMGQDGSSLDVNEEWFGIRTIAVSRRKGFTLNGLPVKLRGAAIHHDNGPIGAVSTDFIEMRRITKLKEAGFNAIRTAHNPASPALLRACDRLGMLVVEEAFDTWTVPKNDYDYTLVFSENWERDLTAMIDEAYNHPSVVMYSTGNEIADTGTPSGAKRGRNIAEKARYLDGTRLITNSINGMVSVMDLISKLFADSQQKSAQEGQNAINGMMTGFGQVMRQIQTLDIVTQATEEAFSSLDVAGYNYMDTRYEKDRLDFPNRIICGTETFPPDIDIYWKKVLSNPHVIGDFVWTGWDYMGEPGIGAVKYATPSMDYGMCAGYPCYLANVGEISISGFRRPASYYHEIVLGRRNEPYIAVQNPHHHDDLPIGTPWSWSDSLSSWTWEGFEGKPIKIEVYTDAEEIELFHNHTSLGKKTMGESDRFKAVFDAIYRPGELVAVASAGGVEKGRFSLRTAEGTPRLSVRPEHMEIPLDGMIFAPITISDQAGDIFVDRSDTVKVAVEGPAELLGLGNDDPYSTENFRDSVRSTFEGRLIAIVRPYDVGDVAIRVSGAQYHEAYVTVHVTK